MKDLTLHRPMHLFDFLFLKNSLVSETKQNKEPKDGKKLSGIKLPKISGCKKEIYTFMSSLK